MATAQAEGTDTSALFERLRKEAECLLCFRTVEEPKVLRCHHSFCLKCLNKRAMEAEKEGKSEINCIVCHSSVKIPRGGRFDDHRTSFYLNRLAEIVSIGVSNSKTQICWNCNESKTLQSYCFECEHFICRACEEYHKWDSLTHSHHTVLIRDLKEQDFDRIIRRPVMCEQKNHNKQSVEFYCHDCKVCICKLCVDELHDAHNIEGVEKASEQSKLNIMDNVQKLKTRLADCEEEVEKLQKGAVKREQNMSAIEDEIHKNVEEAILKLKLHEQEVLAKLDNLGNEQQSAFVAQQERNVSRLTMLKDFLAYGENVLSNLSLPGLEDHYTIFKQFEQALDVDDDDDDDDSFNPPHVNYVPNKEFADIIKKCGLGQIIVRFTDPSKSFLDGNFPMEVEAGKPMSFTVVTRDQEGEGFYCADDQVTVNIYSPTGEELQKEIEDSKDGRYKVTYTPQGTGQHSVVVEVNGEPLAGSPWRVQVISS